MSPWHSVDFSVSFMGKTLTHVDSARDLGVIIDSHLTYDSHISHLVSSCLSKLVQINRVKNSFDKDILLLHLLYSVKCFIVRQFGLMHPIIT